MNDLKSIADRFFRVLIAVLFLCYSVFPQQFAIAQIRDCGPHKVSPCGEHDNEHYVLGHTEAFSGFEDSQQDSESSPSHDRSHQIDQKSPCISLFNSLTFELTSVQFFLNRVTTPLVFFSTELVNPEFSRDPPGKRLHHASLKTIRLQV